MAGMNPALSVVPDPFAETAQRFVKHLLNGYSLAGNGKPGWIWALQSFRLSTEKV